MTRGTRAGSIALVVATAVLAGCNTLGLDSSDPADDLSEQERRWKALDIHDYSYQYARLCFCGSRPNAVEIVVQDDSVIAVVDPVTAEPVDRALLGFTPGTIDDVFDSVRDVIARDPDEIELTFDSRYHFPKNVEVDYIKAAIDDELTIKLSNFLKYERLE